MVLTAGVLGCATPSPKGEEPQSQESVVDYKSSCGGKISSEPEHTPFSSVQREEFGGSQIVKYKTYYFTQSGASSLREFIVKNSIQLVVDLRANAQSETLSDGFPAVYWHHPFDEIKNVNRHKVEVLLEHLDTFSEKATLLIANDSDAAFVAFAKYWAEAHSLNQEWVLQMVGDLGLKNQQWLRKWDRLLSSQRPERKSASEKFK